MEEHLKSTISMRYLATQIDQLDAYGYEQEKALSFLHLRKSNLTDPLLRIDIQRVEALYRDAAKFLNEPNLGLQLGHSFRISNYAQTGSIYAFCKDLKHVIEMNAKYQRIAIDAGNIFYDQAGWGGDKGHFLSLRPYENTRECIHVLNMIAGAYATTFKWLSWSSGKELKSASFIQKKPADMTPFKDIYECPIYFEQEKMGIEFFQDAIDAPLTTYNAEQLAISISKLDNILAVQDTSESLEGAVRQSIRGALALGQISLPIVASRLSLSERQLRQNLKKANLAYRTLLETERQNLFSELHAKGANFSAISQELCYNDQAAFNRAFKRWYGVTPGQYPTQTAVSA